MIGFAKSSIRPTDWPEYQGFRALRFWNNEVLNAGGSRDWIVAANR
jgi:very-short-patch-repair endonuclease